MYFISQLDGGVICAWAQLWQHLQTRLILAANFRSCATLPSPNYNLQLLIKVNSAQLVAPETHWGVITRSFESTQITFRKVMESRIWPSSIS